MQKREEKAMEARILRSMDKTLLMRKKEIDIIKSEWIKLQRGLKEIKSLIEKNLGCTIIINKRINYHMPKV